MSGTVEEMTRLTKKIEDDVSKSIDIIDEFLIIAKDVVKEYIFLFEEEEVFLENFESQMGKQYDLLFDYKNNIINQVINFDVFTKEFKNIFSSSKESVLELEELKSEFEYASKIMDEVQEKATDEIERLLEENHMTHWDITNNKLQNVIDKFTIFSHKEAASSLGDFAIDEDSAADSGDITLF